MSRSQPAVFVPRAVTVIFGAAILCLLLPATAAWGQTPAFPVPQQLWGDLQPTDPSPLPNNRDSTDFDEFGGDFFHTTQWWMSIDIEGGFAFTSSGHFVEVWNLTNPEVPTKVGGTTFQAYLFLDLGEQFTGWPARDIDLPPGNSNVGAQVGKSKIGMAIYDFTDKVTPRVIYQQTDTGGATDFAGLEVYAGTVNGRNYAFGAMESSGLRVYDMTQAQNLASPCLDNLSGTACSGVYKGRLGTRSNVQYVDGADRFVAASFGPSRGFQIWDLGSLPTTLPATPKLEALNDQIVYGVALWQQGTKYYLAADIFARVNNVNSVQGRIYDVSCIQTSCSGLGSPVWQQTLGPQSSGVNFITFSRGGSTPFLYFGNENRLTGGPQREWLYDVSVPSQPIEVTPNGVCTSSTCPGFPTSTPTDYWSWYYQGNPTGFNNVGPRRGKFNGDHFYRAGWSIFDVHKLVGAVAPTADFTWQSSQAPMDQVYPGVPVNFFDASAGNPTSRSWSFTGGSPSTSSQENPVVTFSTPGAKSVTLTVTNDVGSDSITHTVQVLDPIPVVGGVTPNLSQALQCQPVTFTAEDVTGRPPLTFSWRVLDALGLPVAGPVTDDETYLWQTGAGTLPGTYNGEVTVNGPGGTSGAVLSAAVTIQALPTLPGAGTFAPTHDPIANGGPLVQFHVTASGATEWNWDFGDGTTTGWVSDPVTGPNPTHIYSAVGNYNVTVQVRNCVAGPVTSSVLAVSITQIEVLEAFFRPNPPIGCVGTTCTWETNIPLSFVDESSPSVIRWDYDWDGNGTFEDANHTSPVNSHTYTVAGTFIPKLRVSNGAQTYIFPDDNPDHNGYTITVNSGTPPPTPSITLTGPTSGIVGQNLNYSAAATNCTPSPNGWSWTTSGANGSSTTNTITLSWPTAGTKVVRASNSACGTAEGARTVFITDGGGGGDVTAIFGFSPTNPGVDQTVTFDGSASQGSPDSYLWDFGDGSRPVSGQVVEHSFAAEGTYLVKLTVSAPGDCGPFGCFDETTRSVIVGEGGPPPPPPPPPGEDLAAKFTFSPTTPEVGQPVTFDGRSSTGGPNAFSWTFGDDSEGATGSIAQHTFAEAGEYNVTLTIVGPGNCTPVGCLANTSKTVTVVAAGCDGDPDALCLLKNRFKVSVSWTDVRSGTTGIGRPVPVNPVPNQDTTGFFWFFSPTNTELVVKLINGVPVNNAYWFFYGALSDVEYDIIVEDLLTGDVQVYHNEAFNICGDADNLAFPQTQENLLADPSVLEGVPGRMIAFSEPLSSQDAVEPTGAAGITSDEGSCQESAETLCLLGKRFEVAVDWNNQRDGTSGSGQAVVGTDQTGYFWFFNRANVELVVKAIDAQVDFGHFWFFYGALSDIEYTIRVTDTETGQTKEYVNLPRNICGVADTTTF